MNANGFIFILLVLVICIVIFLVSREYLCWYWKVNKRLEIEQQILEELQKLNNVPIQQRDNEEIAKEIFEEDPDSPWKVGAYVVRLATEERYIIESLNADGTVYARKNNVIAGTFNRGELILWDEYLAKRDSAKSKRDS